MSLPPTSLIPPRTWRPNGDAKLNHGNEEFFISTDPNLLSAKAVNDAFAMDFLYWAKPFPEDVMKQLLFGSLCFGVYRCVQDHNASAYVNNRTEINTPEDIFNQNGDGVDSPILKGKIEQVGLARLVTDTVTFGYLTDVYILPDYQGCGLGKWLIDCIAEALSDSNMPYLRRVMLVTTSKEKDGGRAEKFYADSLGMSVIGHEERVDIGRKLSFMCARPDLRPERTASPGGI